METELERINNIEAKELSPDSKSESLGFETINDSISKTTDKIKFASESLKLESAEFISNLSKEGDTPELELIKSIGQSANTLKEEAQESIEWLRERFNLSKMEKEQFSEIEIQGSEEFRKEVIQAIEFLSLAAEKMEFVQANIGRIQEWEHSGMNMFKDKPTFEIGNLWKDKDPFYLASAIAHDSYHSHLCQESQQEDGKIIPGAFGGKEAEKKCIAFQIETLEEIKNSDYMNNFKENRIHIQSLIDELRQKEINPTYQEIEYEKRDW